VSSTLKAGTGLWRDNQRALEQTVPWKALLRLSAEMHRALGIGDLDAFGFAADRYFPKEAI